jgi:hypothetical protein
VACLPPLPGWSLPCDGRALVRIDTAANAAAERIRFDPGLNRLPLKLAVGRGRFWFAAPSSGLRLEEVDRTGAVSDVAVGAWVLSPRRGALWSASRYGCEVWRIPAVGGPTQLPDALRQFAGGRGGCYYKRGLTQAGDGTLWIVGFRDRAHTGLLIHLDPRRNRPLGPLLTPGHEPVAITAGAGAIWVVNRADGTLSRIDP